MRELSSQEVAEQLGVSLSTLKNWAVRLPVPSSLGPDGLRRFPEEAVEVLLAVKNLREEQRSYETIRRVIGPITMLTGELALDAFVLPAAPEALAPEVVVEASSIVVTAAETRPLSLPVPDPELLAAHQQLRRRATDLERALAIVESDRERLSCELTQANHLIGQYELAASRRRWWQLW